MKVKRVIELLEENGWKLDRMVGSHRQYKKPGNRFVITVAGALREEVDKGTLANIRRSSGLEEIR